VVAITRQQHLVEAVKADHVGEAEWPPPIPLAEAAQQYGSLPLSTTLQQLLVEAVAGTAVLAVLAAEQVESQAHQMVQEAVPKLLAVLPGYLATVCPDT
jgi:hypothetical protein